MAAARVQNQTTSVVGFPDSAVEEPGANSNRFQSLAHNRVTLVDDDPNYSFVFEKVAARHGIEVCFTKSSREFIDSFEESPSPLVLIDLEMTDLYGVAWKFAGVSTVIEFRRRFGRAAKIWVVTGATDNPNLISACLKAGADDFIWKDVDISDICRKIQSTLDLP